MTYLLNGVAAAMIPSLAAVGVAPLHGEERKRKGLPTKLDGRDRSPLLAGRGKKRYTTRGLHKLVATAATGG